jgi:maltose-binding protein MalE
LLYIPQDDLFGRYREDSYHGGGPSLLFGPSEWGADLYDELLITDLKQFVPPNYLEEVNSAALATGEYQDALISLPLSVHGLVMFRNNKIITTPAGTFDELTSLAGPATHGGVVGSYLERGSYFSSAGIIGLGGSLMDENGYPEFNDEYGLEWFDLLNEYDVAGAVTFNTNRDLDMFKKGRVGIIIDGSWNISMLAGSVGAENLAIDPWPEYGTGKLSGWVVAESVYLNTNTSSDDMFASLSFMGYLLDPNVQKHMAEVGHIPSVVSTQPRDPFILQAMKALAGGVPYPVAIDENILSIYWNELDMAIQSVFTGGIEPSTALKDASENITAAINELKNTP